MVWIEKSQKSFPFSKEDPRFPRSAIEILEWNYIKIHYHIKRRPKHKKKQARKRNGELIGKTMDERKADTVRCTCDKPEHHLTLKPSIDRTASEILCARVQTATIKTVSQENKACLNIKILKTPGEETDKCDVNLKCWWMGGGAGAQRPAGLPAPGADSFSGIALSKEGPGHSVSIPSVRTSYSA